MTDKRIEPGYDDDGGVSRRDPSLGLAADLSQVLVVGLSQINRIVVSKIVERCGLKSVAEAPTSAIRVLPMLYPGLVILDGGADNRDCDPLMPGIVALRRVSGRDVPGVILLSNRTGDPQSLALPAAVDAVVAKPLTTERLQPVIERLVERARR